VQISGSKHRELRWFLTPCINVICDCIIYLFFFHVPVPFKLNPSLCNISSIPSHLTQSQSQSQLPLSHHEILKVGCYFSSFPFLFTYRSSSSSSSKIPPHHHRNLFLDKHLTRSFAHMHRSVFRDPSIPSHLHAAAYLLYNTGLLPCQVMHPGNPGTPPHPTHTQIITSSHRINYSVVLYCIVLLETYRTVQQAVLSYPIHTHLLSSPPPPPPYPHHNHNHNH
jgi:hypothetical protein